MMILMKILGVLLVASCIYGILCLLPSGPEGDPWEDEREYLVGLLTERDLAKYTAWLEEDKR